MMRKRKTVVAKRITPKVMTGIPKLFGILNDPLGNQIESKLMEREEADQRKYDRFWGQDKDLQDREIERFYMAQEDAASMANEKWYETVEIHKRWDEEYQRNLWFENRSQAKYKEIERREYLKFVNSSLSSDEVVNFIWDRKLRSDVASRKDHTSSAQQQGLIFSDLSAINREVALSLPTTVGALHMSVHMDGLQQSRAIVDGASAAFKQTLRRMAPEALERSLYILVSSMQLAMIVVFWSPLPAPLWTIAAQWGTLAVLSLFALGNLLRHPTGPGGRDTRKNALFARHATAHFFGIVLAHIGQFVHIDRVVNLG